MKQGITDKLGRTVALFTNHRVSILKTLDLPSPRPMQLPDPLHPRATHHLDIFQVTHISHRKTLSQTGDKQHSCKSMWIYIWQAQLLAPFLFLADTVIQYKSCAQACSTCHDWSSRWLCNSRLISLISVKKKWLLLLHTGQTGVKLSLDLFHILTHVLYIFLVLEKNAWLLVYMPITTSY